MWVFKNAEPRLVARDSKQFHNSKKILKVCQIALARWCQSSADRVGSNGLTEAIAEGSTTSQRQVDTDRNSQRQGGGAKFTR